MIVAIDPSLSATAVVRGDVRNYEVAVFGSENRSDSVYRRIQRYRGLVEQVAGFIGRAQPDAIFIEGYSYGSNDARAKFIAEYGGLLRDMLLGYTSDVYEIAPSSLKKFVGAKPKQGKDGVAAGVQRLYGVTFPTSDETDAYALYRLGLCVLGCEETAGLAQAEVVSQIINPRPRKRKVRKGGGRRSKLKDKTLF